MVLSDFLAVYSMAIATVFTFHVICLKGGGSWFSYVPNVKILSNLHIYCHSKKNRNGSKVSGNL